MESGAWLEVSKTAHILQNYNTTSSKSFKHKHKAFMHDHRPRKQNPFFIFIYNGGTYIKILNMPLKYLQPLKE